MPGSLTGSGAWRCCAAASARVAWSLLRRVPLNTVRKTVKLCEENERPVATPQQARAILGLTA